MVQIDSKKDKWAAARSLALDFQAACREIGLPADKVTIRQAKKPEISVGKLPREDSRPDQAAAPTPSKVPVFIVD